MTTSSAYCSRPTPKPSASPDIGRQNTASLSARHHRAPNVTIEFGSDGSAVVLSHGGLSCGRHALAILEAFSEPRPLADGIAHIEHRALGRQDWVDLTETVVGMVHAGILLADSGATPTSTNQRGFAAPGQHVMMLNDERRTASFVERVREVVRPGDIVVDIGTGTGVLAVAAAQAGARHVYAIEATVGRWARQVAEANEVGDRVSVIDGWSSAVELPEAADVLVSETVGNEPLEERILETYIDARRRFLRPGARLLPSQLRIIATVVELTEEARAARTFTGFGAARWQDRYGIDFSPLVGTSPVLFMVGSSAPLDARALAPPVVVADIDLATVQAPVVDTEVPVAIVHDGDAHGVVVSFEAELGAPEAVLTRPWDAKESGWSWGYPVWLLADRITVNAGERMLISYRYGVAGVPAQEMVHLRRSQA